MLNEQAVMEIEEEARHGPRRAAACIDALKVAQREHGWVADEDVDEVARLLEMTRDEVDAVATFYNLIYRRPVGRHVILVCDSVSCWLMGYSEIFHRLRERLGIGLGETSADGMFTLLPVPCLGACDRAPAMMIDETLYTRLNPEKIDSIIEEYRHREA